MAKLITNLAKSSRKSKEAEADLETATSDIIVDPDDQGVEHETQAAYNIGEINIADVAGTEETDMNLKAELKKAVGGKGAEENVEEDSAIWVSENVLDGDTEKEDDFLLDADFDPENDEGYDE
jgi:hypothetical protein